MAASEEPELLIGVDTGGTYTDAVAIEAASGTVLAAAKALTTRHDLSVGVSEALAKVVVDIDVSNIGLVSVSTTLATNAVVEGHGSPILVLLVGFDDKMIERTGIGSAFSDAHIVRIDGGHNHYGLEQTPLDTEAVAAALEEHASGVRAIAVASTFAVRNPDHESAIRDLIVERTELPVTVSSSLSDSLDAPRRALTTALNARLLSRITDLVSAVNRSLETLAIDAPVMVAKGDGSLAIAESVERRPIETILSGPAASIVGAAMLTGLDDFILSDIGGTTTDVGMVRDGRPRLVADGARVGGWRTMVEAIDVRTTGLGGDSAVRTDKTNITLGPERRVPLSLAANNSAANNSEVVVSTLRDQLADPPSRDFAAVFVQRVDSEERAADDAVDLSAVEQRVYDRSTTSAEPLLKVARGALERKAVDDLATKGLIQVVGFTPSDAALVLKKQSNWDDEAARAGAELLAWYTGEETEAFCQRVWSETVRRSAGCILDVALEDTVTESLSNSVTAAAAAGGGVLGAVSVTLNLETPVVAVGGPAGVYYQEVAERVGAELVLPDDFAVANAVGAAVGYVVGRGHSEVHADGPGSYRIVAPDHNELSEDAATVIDEATAVARTAAKAALEEGTAGLTHGPIEERVYITRHDDPNADGDKSLYGAEIEVEVRVRPNSP